MKTILSNATRAGSALLLLAAACGGGAPGDATGATEAEAPLYASSGKKWPRPAGEAVTVVPVCWLDAGWETEKEWVRDAVERAWVRHSAIALTGFGRCAGAAPRGIRIRVEDKWPESPVGTDNELPSQRMRLNFTYSAETNCQGADRERCIRWTAVHEFGHALGFQHEQDRTDPSAAEKACVDAMTTSGDRHPGSGDSTLGTPWDWDSVMNYCNKPSLHPAGTNHIYNGGLSAWDVVGIQNLYGPKPRQALVGARGRCVEVAGGPLAPGEAERADRTPVQQAACTGKANQAWSAAAGVPGGPLAALGKCLDLEPDPFTCVPFRTVVNRCDATVLPFQDLRPLRMEVRALGDRCLHATAATSGAAVVVGDCKGGPLDRWTFRPRPNEDEGDLVLDASPAGSELCAKPTRVGDGVALVACTVGIPPGAWRARGGALSWHLMVEGGGVGRFRLPRIDSDACLTPLGRTTALGAPFTTAACDGSLAQRVKLHLGLRPDPAQPLALEPDTVDVLGASDAFARDGQRLRAAPDLATAQQVWDYWL